MTPIKIAFILPSLESGGAERVLIMLMNAVDRHRFSPVLISIKGHGPLSALIAPDIPVVMLDHPGPLPLCFFPLLTALRAQKPDMVISTVTPMNFVTLLTRPFFPKAKYIAREATMPSFFLKKFFRYKPGIWLLFQLYRMADAVICPARGMMAELQKFYHLKADRFFWLPNPVDTAKIQASLQTITPHEANLEFVSVGRLVHEKGYDRLISALKSFNPASSWHLTLVGDGPEKEFLTAQIAENNLQKNITLTGYTDNPWPYIAGADIFLLPSRLEGLPNVVLESLACGTRVIALQEAGGIAEIATIAQPGDILVVPAVSDMIAAMEQAKRKDAPSVQLPALYRLETVNRRFGLFLERLSGKKGFEDL